MIRFVAVPLVAAVVLSAAACQPCDVNGASSVCDQLDYDEPAPKPSGEHDADGGGGSEPTNGGSNGGGGSDPGER